MDEENKDKIFMIDFIHNLGQADFVFKSLQKPFSEMTKDELENAFLMYSQISIFWKERYDWAMEQIGGYEKIVEEQQSLIELLKKEEHTFKNENFKNYKRPSNRRKTSFRMV